MTCLRGHLPFSQQGDSGALIFDGHGRVVGMVFGGIEGGMYSYVTHISDLLSHIKEKTTSLTFESWRMAMSIRAKVVIITIM